jgi:excisionase family DNA binding protein
MEAENYKAKITYLIKHIGIAELANKLGVSKGTIYYWLRDKASPTRTTGGRLIRVYTEYLTKREADLEEELDYMRRVV